MTQPEPKQPTQRKTSLWRIAFSTAAAAFGVQSNKNREQDFQQATIFPFIVAGITFTALFIGALILIVSLVLR